MKPCTLVLLPGLDGTGRLFAPLIQHLPDWINPVVVSYSTDTPQDYDQLAKIVFDALPQDTEFVVLGESFSGPLAVMTAARNPEGLRGIILCASFIRKPFPILPAWLRHFSVPAIYQLWPATIRLRGIFSDEKHRELVRLALDAISSVSPGVIARRVKAILTVNVEEQLRQTTVPILYLAGRKDHLIRKHNVATVTAIRPDTRVVTLDTQHLVLQLAPEEAASHIEQFIRRLLQD